MHTVFVGVQCWCIVLADQMKPLSHGHPSIFQRSCSSPLTMMKVGVECFCFSQQAWVEALPQALSRYRADLPSVRADPWHLLIATVVTWNELALADMMWFWVAQRQDCTYLHGHWCHSEQFLTCCIFWFVCVGFGFMFGVGRELVLVTYGH